MSIKSETDTSEPETETTERERQRETRIDGCLGDKDTKEQIHK